MAKILITVLPNAVGHANCMRSLGIRLAARGHSVSFGGFAQDRALFESGAWPFVALAGEWTGETGETAGYLYIEAAERGAFDLFVCDGLSPPGAVVAKELGKPCVLVHVSMPSG